MGALGSWLVRNVEALLGLGIALVVGFLGIIDILDVDQVNSGILLVLAVLAAAILRDRTERNSVEADLGAALQASSAALRDLPARLERIAEIDEVVTVARKALDDTATVRILRGAEIGRALAAARANTDQWIFKGGTGTFIRAVTLPECIHNARRERRDLKMRLGIIDPSDDFACETYTRFRRSLSTAPDGTGEPWTFNRTRNEAYATVLAAAWYAQRFNLLDIDVRLSPVVTTFRWDLSSRFLIVTQEDRDAPTLLVEQGRSIYNHWKTELKISLDQARPVLVDSADNPPLSDEPTIAETRELFAWLGVAVPATLSDDLVQDIVDRALRARNPYSE